LSSALSVSGERCYKSARPFATRASDPLKSPCCAWSGAWRLSNCFFRSTRAGTHISRSERHRVASRRVHRAGRHRQPRLHPRAPSTAPPLRLCCLRRLFAMLLCWAAPHSRRRRRRRRRRCRHRSSNRHRRYRRPPRARRPLLRQRRRSAWQPPLQLYRRCCHLRLRACCPKRVRRRPRRHLPHSRPRHLRLRRSRPRHPRRARPQDASPLCAPCSAERRCGTAG
jgi:hypothetical protein